MKTRKWPTVPEILQRASEVHHGTIGAPPAVFFLDAETKAKVAVHAATAPLLLKAVRPYWPAEQLWNVTIYRRPA